LLAQKRSDSVDSMLPSYETLYSSDLIFWNRQNEASENPSAVRFLSAFLCLLQTLNFLLVFPFCSVHSDWISLSSEAFVLEHFVAKRESVWNCGGGILSSPVLFRIEAEKLSSFWQTIMR
jgi:hypothetical protein